MEEEKKSGSTQLEVAGRSDKITLHRPYGEAVPPGYGGYLHQEEEEGAELFLKYWHIIWRRKGTILLITFLGFLGGVLFALPQTPIYQSRATIEVQGINQNFMNMRDVNPEGQSSAYQSVEDIQTQISILQSRSLLDRIVEKLKLQDQPGFNSETDRISAWRKALGLLAPEPMTREQLVSMAAQSLKVTPVRQTRIVEILADSPNPQLAAAFANTLCDEYIDLGLESRWKSSERTGEWLTRQLDELRIKLEKSEDELQTYARETGLMFTGEKDNVAEERLKQVQEELSKAQADRISKQSIYELARSSPLEAVREISEGSGQNDSRNKLAELRAQLAELSQSLTPEHYKVKRLQAQIDEMEGALKKERASAMGRIQNAYLAAQRREKLLAADYSSQSKLVAQQAEKAIHYNILKREVDTNRLLYDSILQKVKESSVTSALRATGIRVVDRATAPSLPYKPNVLRSSAVGLFIGMFLGIAFVLMRESVDHSIRTPGDASLYLNFPELGVIPSAKLDASIYSSDRRKSLLAKNPESRLELVTWQRKPSLLAESFRSTLASMLFMNTNGNRPFVILVSSCSAGDGKSTIASNLALALAEINHRVLLIDSDLRKPRLHEIFDVDNQRGLSDLLLRREPLATCPLGEIVQETAVQDLFVLPAGGSRDSIANLLHSVRLRELINRFRDEFHTVLIDSPPLIGHLSDARILGRLSDGVILVIRAGKTTRDSILAVTQRLADDGTKVLGTVLNDWNPKAAAGYGYGYRYGYHYKKYDGYYHYGDGKNSSK